MKPEIQHLKLVSLGNKKRTWFSPLKLKPFLSLQPRGESHFIFNKNEKNYQSSLPLELFLLKRKKIT